MCKPTVTDIVAAPAPSTVMDKPKVKTTPSLAARYGCAGLMVAVFAVWAKYTFIDESKIGEVIANHHWSVVTGMTLGYLISLPLLRMFTETFLKDVDVKLLLREAMILYNGAQVVLNVYMVSRFVFALLFRDHKFIAGPPSQIDTGATFTIWVHYTDKFMEFFDTYFMILRGRMDQVSFLHVYHHASIAPAWFACLNLYPGGDAYFGALCNSFIHILMYSYYTLSLMKVPCPWKRYLTQAQLIQFCTVICFSAASVSIMGGETTHLIAHGIQVWEMSSLFILFMAFYQKSYKKPKKVN